MQKFNKEKEYERDIEPLIRNLKELCNDHKIPFFVTCAVKDDGKKTTYKSEVIDPAFFDLDPVSDRIKDHINVMNGFTTIYPQPEELDEIEI